jgi:hypothetical protein
MVHQGNNQDRRGSEVVDRYPRLGGQNCTPKHILWARQQKCRLRPRVPRCAGVATARSRRDHRADMGHRAPESTDAVTNVRSSPPTIRRAWRLNGPCDPRIIFALYAIQGRTVRPLPSMSGSIVRRACVPRSSCRALADNAPLDRRFRCAGPGSAATASRSTPAPRRRPRSGRAGR